MVAVLKFIGSVEKAIKDGRLSEATRGFALLCAQTDSNHLCSHLWKASLAVNRSSSRLQGRACAEFARSPARGQQSDLDRPKPPQQGSVAEVEQKLGADISQTNQWPETNERELLSWMPWRSTLRSTTKCQTCLEDLEERDSRTRAVGSKMTLSAGDNRLFPFYGYLEAGVLARPISQLLLWNLCLLKCVAIFRPLNTTNLMLNRDSTSAVVSQMHSGTLPGASWIL